jgi:hypothetical protein
LRGAEEKVEVVGHQHEAEQLPAKPTDRQSQSIHKALAVRLVVEDPLTPIAPAHDMIDGASVLDSQRLAHTASLTPGQRCVNRKPNLTPCIA